MVRLMKTQINYEQLNTYANSYMDNHNRFVVGNV